MSPYSHYERICRGHNRIWWLWVFTNHFPIEPKLDSGDLSWDLVPESTTPKTYCYFLHQYTEFLPLYCFVFVSVTLTDFIQYILYIMEIHSSCTPSPFCLFLWPLILTSKSSIPHDSFSLPLSLASRCHDLFSGCLNRLAVIKSYAPLMTLSWGRALVPWGKEIGGKRRERLDAERRKRKGETTDEKVTI